MVFTRFIVECKKSHHLHGIVYTGYAYSYSWRLLRKKKSYDFLCGSNDYWLQPQQNIQQVSEQVSKRASEWARSWRGICHSSYPFISSCSGISPLVVWTCTESYVGVLAVPNTNRNRVVYSSLIKTFRIHYTHISI